MNICFFTKKGLLRKTFLVGWGAMAWASGPVLAEGPTKPTPPTAAPAPEPVKEIKPVFDPGRGAVLIDSVNRVIRDTSSPASTVVGGLRSALDVRLPMILETCDLTISHEILRVAYGVVTEAPDATTVLRELASNFSRREMSEFKGVTPDCAVALKGLGVAVTRVYLGSKWDPK